MRPSIHQPSVSHNHVKARDPGSHALCLPLHELEALQPNQDSDNSETSASSGWGNLGALALYPQPVWMPGPRYGMAKLPIQVLSRFRTLAVADETSTPSSSSSSFVDLSGVELPCNALSTTVPESNLEFSSFFEDDTEDSDDEDGYDSASNADAAIVKSNWSLRCRGLSPTEPPNEELRSSRDNDDRADPVLPGQEEDWVNVPLENDLPGGLTVLDDGRISYSIRAHLGEGAYGTVYLARTSPHDVRLSVPEYVAVKVFLKERLENNVWAHENVVRELFALERAMEKECSHLVCPISAFQDTKNVYVAMQLYGEDLAHLIDWVGVRMSTWYIRVYTAELILAIEQAHAIGFIHRDIKPQNIFIGPGGHLALGDFSLAVWPQLSSPAATWESGAVREEFPVATGGRYAPEQLRGEPCTHKVDLWALGLVLLEMYRGDSKPLFMAREGEKFFGEWEIMNKDIEEEVERTIPSASACDLVKQLLNRDPARRPSLEQIKEHPFFTNRPAFDWDACARGLIQPSYRPTRPREDYLPPTLDVGERIDPNAADEVKFPQAFFNFACMPHHLVPDEAFFPPWKLPTPRPRMI